MSENKEREQPSQEQVKGGLTLDFSTFFLSLASSVQVHLGLIPNPATNKSEKDLTIARQTIDIMNMLKEKTKGNLSGDEQRLVDYILYDLQMKFVEVNKEE
ncbi:MAG: DUF1844 domain-containing protein [Pseudomonadota bacterium]